MLGSFLVCGLEWKWLFCDCLSYLFFCQSETDHRKKVLKHRIPHVQRVAYIHVGNLVLRFPLSSTLEYAAEEIHIFTLTQLIVIFCQISVSTWLKQWNKKTLTRVKNVLTCNPDSQNVGSLLYHNISWKQSRVILLFIFLCFQAAVSRVSGGSLFTFAHNVHLEFGAQNIVAVRYSFSYCYNPEWRKPAAYSLQSHLSV